MTLGHEDGVMVADQEIILGGTRHGDSLLGKLMQDEQLTAMTSCPGAVRMKAVLGMGTQVLVSLDQSHSSAHSLTADFSVGLSTPHLPHLTPTTPRHSSSTHLLSHGPAEKAPDTHSAHRPGPAQPSTGLTSPHDLSYQAEHGWQISTLLDED